MPATGNVRLGKPPAGGGTQGAPEGQTSATSGTYDAFISYRRSDGARAAAALRQCLRDYRLPPSLAPASERGPLNIYLDVIYERAAEDFFVTTIKPALAASRFMILVQTPDTLRPRQDGAPNWVAREIEYFETLPQRQNISVALAKGEFGGPLAGGLQRSHPNGRVVVAGNVDNRHRNACGLETMPQLDR